MELLPFSCFSSRHHYCCDTMNTSGREEGIVPPILHRFARARGRSNYGLTATLEETLKHLLCREAHCKGSQSLLCTAKDVTGNIVRPKEEKKKTVGAVALSIVKRHAQCHSADIFCFVLFLSLHHIMIIIIHVIRRVLFVY